jgi:hypothetical protein
LSREESQMRLVPGVPANYTEASRETELAITDVTDRDHDTVVSIPSSLLAAGREIHLPQLPFALRLKTWIPDAVPAGPMSGGADKIQATAGIGARLMFASAPAASRNEDDPKPAGLVEVVASGQNVGVWTVSTWLTSAPLVGALHQMLGNLLGGDLDRPQSFVLNGRTYEIALRPARHYLPCTITLLQFKHDVYPGTDIPRNFSSRIHLHDPASAEDRDVLIYMNNPLRYRGQTFYQASFEPGDRVSILQVVHNPVSIAPYLGCSVIGLGLVIQFAGHLFGFASRRRPKTDAVTTASVTPPAPARAVSRKVLA